MENASKALVIAGGILIALLTICAFMLTYNQLGNLQRTTQKTEQEKQIAEFNAQYLSYDKSIMYGIDIITILNKAENNNDRYNGEDDYQITITIKPNEDDKMAYKEFFYKCTDTTYHKNGRIASMTFEKITEQPNI